jgi:hypothetical protein
MGLQDVVRWFLPKEDHFYDFVERQASVAHEASLALSEFKQEGTTAESVRERVQALEHKGDAIVHELEEALARTFVTPIDREDLQKLSKELDDILDLMNGAVRACVLFGVSQPTEPMKKLIDKLSECTENLKGAVPKLREHKYAELIECSRTLRKLEKDADIVFRDAVSQLFRDDAVDAKKLMREREVLDDLENAIDHCEHVSSTLANLAVKHG